MKRLKAMTNREWVQKHFPKNVNESYCGGVCSCPKNYDLRIYKKCNCYKVIREECTDCWSLPAKRKGKYIMKVVKQK